MSSTIPVYVQSPNAEAFFADWPLNDLDSVIPLLARWGVSEDGGEDTTPESSAFGEFVVQTKRVVFRVSVGANE